MGIFDVKGRLSGKSYSVQISGEVPSATEAARIQQYVMDQESAFASQYQQAFGTAPTGQGDGTAFGRGWDSGVQSLKGNLGELAQTIGQRTGLGSLADYGTSVETAAAREQARLDLENPAPLSWRDVNSLGTAGTYLGEMAGASAPQMLGGAAGGLGAAAAAPLVGIGAGTAGVLGAGLTMLPMYTGENLQAQEAVAGENNVNLTKALGTAAFQSALDAASLKVLGRLGVGKAALAALEGEVGQKLTGRVLTGLAEGVATEAPTEALQQLATIWQSGGDLNSPEAHNQIIDALVGGGVLGGLLGGAGRGAFGKRPGVEATPPTATPPTATATATATAPDTAIPSAIPPTATPGPTLQEGQDQGALFDALPEQTTPAPVNEIPVELRDPQGKLDLQVPPSPLTPSEQPGAQAEMDLTLPEGGQGDLFGAAPPVRESTTVVPQATKAAADAEERANAAKEAQTAAEQEAAAAEVKTKKTIANRQKRVAKAEADKAKTKAKEAKAVADKAVKEAEILKAKAAAETDAAAKKAAAENPAPRTSTEDASAVPTETPVAPVAETPVTPATEYNALGKGRETGTAAQVIPTPNVPRTAGFRPAVVEAPTLAEDAAVLTGLRAKTKDQLGGVENKGHRGAQAYFNKTTDTFEALDNIAADAAMPGVPGKRVSTAREPLSAYWQGTGQTPATAAVAWVKANMSPKAVAYLDKAMQSYSDKGIAAISRKVDQNILSERARTTEATQTAEAAYWSRMAEGSAEKAAAARARNAAPTKKVTLALTRQAITQGLSEPLHPATIKHLRMGRLTEALESIAATSSDPYIRNMATKLSKFVGNTKVYTTYGDSVEVTDMLRNREDPTVLDTGAYALMTKADFDALFATEPEYATSIQDAIFLNEDGGLTAHAVLHEMIHAATAKELYNNPKGPVAQRLDALRKDVLKQTGKPEYDAATHSYGLQDVMEFAAEVLSNPEFQAELDRVFPNDKKVSGFKQALHEVLNFVRSRILGRPPKDYTVATIYDEADFLAQSVFNVAPEFAASTPLFSTAMQPAEAKMALTRAGKLAKPFSAADAVNTAAAVSRSLALDLKRPVMPAILNYFTPVRNLVDLAEQYFPETAMKVYEALAKQKNFEQELNETITNTMKQVDGFLKASPDKAETFHSMRTMASRFEIDVREGEKFYSRYVLGYFPLNSDGTVGKRIFEDFDSFEERKDRMDAINLAEANGAAHTKARALNDPSADTLALYKALRKQYDSLGKEGQAVYNQVLGVFEAMHYETAKAVKNRINAMLPDTADTDNAHTRNIILRGIYNKIFAEKGLMVYQPLQRSGEYKLTYNGVHPVTNTTEPFVHSFDTPEQRDKAVALLQSLPKEYNISDIDTPPKGIKPSYATRRAPPPTFVADVTRMITKGAQQDATAARKRVLAQGGTQVEADAKYAEVLADVTNRAESNNRAIIELALDAMPESSIFNAYRARKNVSGFVGDLSPLKAAFDSMGETLDGVDLSTALLKSKLSSMVHQVSAIQHQAESAKITADLTEQLQVTRMTKPEAYADNAQVYYDALTTALNNPTIRRSQFAANMNTGAFVWTLFANVSSAVINISGLMLNVYPRLAMKYGSVNAAKMMLHSLRDISNSGRTRMEGVIGPDGKRTTQAADTGMLGRSIRNYAFGDVDFSVDYRKGNNLTDSLKYLVAAGMPRHMFVDSTIYDHLDTNATNLGEVAQKMLKFGAAPMHHTERVIRESTMIANYRLELQAAAKRKGSPILTEAEMQAAADLAAKQTELMIGTTPSTAAPSGLQKGIMPMVAMYKRYPLAIMHLLLGDMKAAFPSNAKLVEMYGEGTPELANAKENRKIARLQVAGQLGAFALFAGAMGMPLYGLFSDLFDAMFTDPDEEDFDTLTRMYLGELGSKGILNYLLGVDIASRIGMSDIFYRAPLRAADQKWYQNVIEGAGGPAVSLLTGTLPRAMDLYNQGEYFRALEAASPAVVRNGFRSYRFATTGSAESLRGDVISDMSPGDALAQALGFTPSAYVRQLELSSAAKRIDNAITTQRSALLRRMNLAQKNRDQQEVRVILADINDFNRKHPAKKITADSIKRSSDTFARTSQKKLHNGVVYSDRSLPELQQVFDLMDVPASIWD